ncbi:MAG: hypothetical protein LQ341_007222 [Variospora aurantia]|nr:MAG: hypothetical protein LQ341_007222 [Variospora aurantia]
MDGEPSDIESTEVSITDTTGPSTKETMGLSTEMLPLELVTIDGNPNTYLASYNPEASVHISFQLLFLTALNRIMAPLEQLTTAYDSGFRDVVYALFEMSIQMLAFLGLQATRKGLDFATTDPTVSALLYIFSACVPYIGRLAPHLRQFFYASFELFLDFAEAMGRFIPEGAKTASRGFFMQTVPDLYHTSYTMAGSLGRQAGRTAVTVVVVPAQFIKHQAIVSAHFIEHQAIMPLVRLPSTTSKAVGRCMIRPSVALFNNCSSALSLRLRNHSPFLYVLCRLLFTSVYGLCKLWWLGRAWFIFVAVPLLWMIWSNPFLVLSYAKVSVWNTVVVGQALYRISDSVGRCAAGAIQEELLIAGIA